ncbi:MAG: SRPBCC domain-containing protein [Myxococcota bacterium]
MELKTVHVSALIPARHERVYEAWLDEREHTSFVGGKKTIIDARVGGHIRAGDGGYTGVFTELQPGSRIVHTFESGEFPKDAAESQVAIEFSSRADGSTELNILHTGVPAPLVPLMETHWLDQYVTPMRMYFAALPERPAVPSSSGGEAAPAEPSDAAPPARPGARGGGTKKAAAPKASGDTSGAKRRASAAKKTTAATPSKTPSTATRGKSAASKAGGGSNAPRATRSRSTSTATHKKTAAKKKARSTGKKKTR